MGHKMININGRPSPNYLYSGDEIGEGTVTFVTALNSTVHEKLCAVFGYSQNFTVYETKRVNIHGLEYYIGSVIVLKTDDLGHPTFGVIDNIYVIDEKKYFLVNVLETLFYKWQFHSFVVRHTDSIDVVIWQKLKNNFLLTLYKYKMEYFVMNRYSQYSSLQ